LQLHDNTRQNKAVCGMKNKIIKVIKETYFLQLHDNTRQNKAVCGMKNKIIKIMKETYSCNYTIIRVRIKQ
jgi:hypothetical protein